MQLSAQSLPSEDLLAGADDAELMQAAMALARRLAALPANAAQEIKRAFEAGARHDMCAQRACESARQRELLGRHEFAESVRMVPVNDAGRFATRALPRKPFN